MRENDVVFDFDALEDDESDDERELDCGLVHISDLDDESVVGRCDVLVSDAVIDSEVEESFFPLRRSINEPPTTPATAPNPWAERRSTNIADKNCARKDRLKAVRANAEMTPESCDGAMRRAQPAFHWSRVAQARLHDSASREEQRMSLRLDQVAGPH